MPCHAPILSRGVLRPSMASRISWQFPFTLLAMVDLITMAPIFIEEAVGQQISAMSFLRFVRVLRVIRLLKAFRAINSRFSAVGRQLATLILTICTIMFLSAGMVHLVENELYVVSPHRHPLRLRVPAPVATRPHIDN